MHPLPCAVLLATACLLPAAEPPSVTVLVDFEMPPSELSYQAMQAEASSVLGPTGVRLTFKLKSEAGGENFSDVVLMSFQGRCGMNPIPVVFDERGPLAFARTVNGEIQPFGVVRCDRVRNAVKQAMWGRDFKQGDRLMGRALGRVVAHELYHMLARTSDHAASGVAKRALTGQALISDTLRFRPEEVEKLQSLHPGFD